MRKHVARGMVVSLALGVWGCSFGVGAAKGPRQVRQKHEIVDAVAMAITGFGCGLAVIAWASPDSYAPTTDDRSSWKSPDDREDTIYAGKVWTPIACSTAAVFAASGMYG